MMLGGIIVKREGSLCNGCFLREEWQQARCSVVVLWMNSTSVLFIDKIQIERSREEKKEGESKE